ncbi:hypothetical protein K493DRAFT_389948 [Basidiobolus meristosporus CBS 931.73]|uniref:Uncharacterized protein n=1 Tax=Basidiobolus meristosporus CBS 931.73 TaxID=1314790 RepID=A0A1Y1X5B1_9FUNG|nr:hypothetical protein K493DRAFT_389948 [Basidiobolus meristosporus CBS 931.73]|eukprot:ORX80504.1 hypothetical protein K493DRAFT_389948 [Basidiobolus meristosporus CBS 931.73]
MWVLNKLAYALFSISVIGAVPYGAKSLDLQTIKTLVIFGDSFSDTGNVYTLSNKTHPPSYYYNGHFSNGKMWPEYVQEVTTWRVINYAYGGATVNNNIVQGYTGANYDIKVPGVAQQIEAHKEYLAKNPKEVSPNSTLYVIEAAGNDYFYGGPSITPDSVATNVYQTSKVLLEAPFSGVNLLYFNVALDHLPYNMNQNATVRDEARANRIQQNLALKSLIRSNIKVNVKLFDLNGFLARELVSPSHESANIPCVQQPSTPGGQPIICNAPERKVFWDIFHPTTITHHAMAKAILTTLSR